MNEAQAARVLNSVLAVLAGSVLLTCLTAPPLFNAVLWIGREWDWSPLRRLSFEPLMTRLFMIYLVLGLTWAYRRLGDINAASIGLLPGLRWPQRVGRGILIGFVSVCIVLLPALWSGAWMWEPDAWTRIVTRLLHFAVGALLISYIEEVFFCGTCFGALRRLVHWFPAALAVSVTFALIHFLRPQHPEGIVYGQMWTGFSLLPHLLRITSDVRFYFPFGLTLFLMQLTICTYYQRQGHVYHVIGLHAGWVLGLQSARLFFKPDPLVDSFWYDSSNLARTYAASLLIGVFLLHALYARRSRHAD